MPLNVMIGENLEYNMKQIVIGNWKMFGTTAAAEDLVNGLLRGLKEKPPEAEVVICPPFTQLYHVNQLLRFSSIAMGAQDCQSSEEIPHTGDISASMLVDIGAKYVIIGHSERREGHYETDALVREKSRIAQDYGLIPIVCVGETEIERRTGAYRDVIRKQIFEGLPDDFNGIIAYEPVWAINGGMSASLQDIVGMTDIIQKSMLQIMPRRQMEQIRILYGGSVKPDNAESILSLDGVGGVLIGSASLSAEKFLAIIYSAVAQHQY